MTRCSSDTTEHSESTLGKTNTGSHVPAHSSCTEEENGYSCNYLKFSSSVLNKVSSSSLSKFSLENEQNKMAITITTGKNALNLNFLSTCYVVLQTVHTTRKQSSHLVKIKTQKTGVSTGMAEGMVVCRSLNKLWPVAELPSLCV